MKLLQKVKMSYLKGIPYSVFTTSGISTYMSIQYEMNRPFTIPHIHSIKNVLLSGGIGALTGICYLITFPLIGSIYLHNIYYPPSSPSQ